MVPSNGTNLDSLSSKPLLFGNYRIFAEVHMRAKIAHRNQNMSWWNYHKKIAQIPQICRSNIEILHTGLVLQIFVVAVMLRDFYADVNNLFLFGFYLFFICFYFFFISFYYFYYFCLFLSLFFFLFFFYFFYLFWKFKICFDFLYFFLLIYLFFCIFILSL